MPISEGTVEAYEGLRQRVVQLDSGEHVEGLRVFVRCGLAAWAQIRPAVVPSRPPESHFPSGVEAPGLDSFGAELVRLVAGLILSTRPGAIVDQAISDLLLELMQPLTLEVALAVQREVEARIAETDALRRKHVDRAQYEAELARRRYMNVDPGNRLVADNLEAEWNHKLRALAEAKSQYEQQTQKQRLLIDSRTREQLLSLTADFPRIWNDPSVEPRERKRILRLLIEDVTLINSEKIQIHVRLRGGATRSLSVTKLLRISQIRKTKPEVVVEIDRLLDQYCDREVAEILNRHDRRNWRNDPFAFHKVAHVREAYNLQCRYNRLRAKGLLTATELGVRLGVSIRTLNTWARQGLLQKHAFDNRGRCLYEPLKKGAIMKGHGGRGAKQATFGAGPAG